MPYIGALNRVRTGPYSGSTKAEMDTERTRYLAQLRTSGSRLEGSTTNGQSYTFGPRGDWSLAEWARQIENALAQVDPANWSPPSHAIRFRFGPC